jgi:3,4-dihydroxy 2-butanone 4-phosphate synthase
MYAGHTWYDHDKSGYALTKADEKLYAKRHGLVFVEGPEVMKRWEAEKKSRSKSP